MELFRVVSYDFHTEVEHLLASFLAVSNASAEATEPWESLILHLPSSLFTFVILITCAKGFVTSNRTRTRAYLLHFSASPGGIYMGWPNSFAILKAIFSDRYSIGNLCS